jgi:uncharacterized protein
MASFDQRRQFIGRVASTLLTGSGISAFGALPTFAQTDSLQAERQRQKSLPHASDPFWAKLKACTVGFDATHNHYKLTPTPEIKALIGTTVAIRGFTLPLDGSDHTHHFLIGVNTPVCFYHPPGEPNEVVEVFSLKPITWKDSAIFVQGMFKLIDQPDGGVFFQLDNASPIDAPSLLSRLPGMSASPQPQTY